MKLKEIDIKNWVFYYFADIINDTDINFYNILLYKELSESITVYGISFKNSAGLEPLCIRFDKIDGFIIIFDGKIKHLLFFDYGLFNY